MTKKINPEDRKNKEFHSDCFGRYIINERSISLTPSGMCSALTKMKCRGCNFYKPVEKTIEEYEKYGYPIKEEISWYAR